MSDSDHIVEEIRENRRLSRNHATYFEWYRPDVRDRGIVKDFLCARFADQSLPFRRGSLRYRGNGEDPPDCEVQYLDGRKIGIELTEIVDQRSVELRPKPKKDRVPKRDLLPNLRVYTQAEFLELLVCRLGRKRRPIEKIKGGPYSELILLLHTNELFLSCDFCSKALASVRFLSRPKPWTHVYLLFPPEPRSSVGSNEQPDLCQLIELSFDE